MADCIEREAAITEVTMMAEDRRIPVDSYGGEVVGEMIRLLRRIPAADVREVVRGKWKRVVDFTGVEYCGFKETMVVGWGCNVCGYEVDVSEESFNFCPNCGADMRQCPEDEAAEEMASVRWWPRREES